MTGQPPQTLARRPSLDAEHRLGGGVAGLDEAGRGPLAGPVIAAAVVLPAPLPAELAALIDDSKKLSPARRQTAYAALRTSGAIIGLGAASVDEILRLNILQASLLAMRRAFARLTPQPHAALVDGNQNPGLPCTVHCLIGGDQLSLSIAAASIIAKVTRDHTMTRLSQRYPSYHWSQNAGYGTQSHLAALKSQGPTPHHRTSFGPVRRLGVG